MRRKLIPEKEIIALSKSVIQSFYSRDVGNSASYLADDFMWIGAFDFQYTLSKEQFFEVTQSELGANPFRMIDEEFMLLSKSVSTYIVCAKFGLVAETNRDALVQTSTRLTMVWKYIKDELKLIHVHGSNAQDIPIARSNKNDEFAPNKDFFDYLLSLDNQKANHKIPFRDTNGKYRYFLESEILYLEANLQTTYVHTLNDCIKISGLLLENAKALPEHFYRVHKTYIVNTSYVKSLERYKITLLNDSTIPISKEKYIAFRESISNKN